MILQTTPPLRKQLEKKFELLSGIYDFCVKASVVRLLHLVESVGSVALEPVQS